jgi:O-antigen/teichoic acid export membrane protein
LAIDPSDQEQPLGPIRAPSSTARADSGPEAAIDRRTLRGQMVAMTLLTLAASGVNYASNVIFGRMLTPASYGDLTALLALVVIVAMPTTAAQTVVAERLAVFRARDDEASVRYLVRYALAHVGLYSCLLTIAYCLAIPLVVKVLDLQAVGPAIAMAPLITLTFFLPVVYGVLQGLERFIALGAITLGVAASRIAFGVPSTLAGGGAGGPIAGQAMGSLVAVALILYLARRFVVGHGTGAVTRGLRRRIDTRSLVAGGAFIIFALLSNLDVLLAKVFLSPERAGSYSALATIGKIVLFLPAAVSVVMVPYIGRSRAGTGSASSILRISAIAVAVGAAAVAIPAAIEPRLVLRVMFGDRYGDATSGVLPIVLAATLLALLYLLVVYTVAIQDQRWVYLLLGGVGLQVVAISLLHSSPSEIAVVQASVMFVILVVNEMLFHPILRAERLIRRST